MLHSIKCAIKSSPFLIAKTSSLYRIGGRIFNKIKLKGKNNIIETNVPGLFLSHFNLSIRGNNNCIRFKPGGISHIRGLRISITGDNNTIEIGANTSCSDFSICVEDNCNEVLLGDGFRCGANTELAAIEGTSISFGEDCMLSANITVRTGDSHSIVDMEGRRINHSKSLSIGNHVWIGNTVMIFKGAQIGHNSVVAGGSVVTGKEFPPYCIIGGNPAKVIKEGIDWREERI